MHASVLSCFHSSYLTICAFDDSEKKIVETVNPLLVMTAYPFQLNLMYLPFG